MAVTEPYSGAALVVPAQPLAQKKPMHYLHRPPMQHLRMGYQYALTSSYVYDISGFEAATGVYASPTVHVGLPPAPCASLHAGVAAEALHTKKLFESNLTLLDAQVCPYVLNLSTEMSTDLGSSPL
jgi:hypothetical protein